MTVGMACMGIGALSLAFIDEQTSFAFIEIALLVVGVGLGLNTAPVNGVAVAALPPERSGTASGVLNTSPMLGGVAGHAGQDAAAGSGFLPGLQAALIGSGVAEFIGAVISFSFIRHDSLHAKK